MRTLGDLLFLWQADRPYLGYNRIGDAGVQALAQSPHLQNLTTLILGYNGIGEAGREALRNSPYLRRCEVYFRGGGNG